MRFFKSIDINFVKYRRLALSLSGLLILIGFGAMALNHFTTGSAFNFGIDFVGGTLVQVQFNEIPDINEVRASLAEIGFGSAVIQQYGEQNELLIRVQQADTDDLKTVLASIENTLRERVGQDGLEIRRTESVGPQVGSDLRRSAIYAVTGSIILMLVYIAFRFQFRYGVGAVAALVHDVAITLGFFALLRLEMNLPVIAALLTIVGYSLNDTIVVYDRIRENVRLTRRMRFEEMVNRSLNQTLGRTVLTSLTTMLVVLSLVLFGGAVIRTFSLALLVGVLVGTYSSIYVASPVIIAWERISGRSRADRRRSSRR